MNVDNNSNNNEDVAACPYNNIELNEQIVNIGSVDGSLNLKDTLSSK